MGFFKTFAASALAVLVTGILLIFIFIWLLSMTIESSFANFAGMGDERFKVKDNSILHLKLEKEIVDNGPVDEFNFSPTGMEETGKDGMNSIIRSIDRAAKDEKIKGIFLEISVISGGMATIEEIREALIRFKKSGKFIYSYAEIMDQKAYYLATTADQVMLFPEGFSQLTGLSTNVMFLKGMLEKLDVDIQVIRGSNNKFKSAVEPYMYDKMSEANRKQTEKYVFTLWNKMLKGISESRNIAVADLNLMADSLLVRNADQALKYKLVDKLCYRDEALDVMRKKMGGKDVKLRLVTLHEYLNDTREKKEGNPNSALAKKANSKKDKIAVIYATGQIVDGKGDHDIIGSQTLTEQIRKAREDKTIKAIVLRIDSPGGSALASEVIWRETQKAKNVKPFIVSMGDVAASGGYYIACGADKIYAQPNTITGSIGVFGIIPNAERLFRDKLGITFDQVKTNKYSDLGNIFRPLSSKETSIIQKSVDDIYDLFSKRVADGRKISKAVVKDSIGQGRVWSGTDALALKLVDDLGGLDKAVAEAVKRSKVKSDYIIVEYPEIKKPFEEFFSKFGQKDEDEDEEDEVESETSAKIKFNMSGLPASMVSYLEGVSKAVKTKGVQALMPFYLEIQ